VESALSQINEGAHLSDENRNDSGQFASAPEPAFGLASVEQESGVYVPMASPEPKMADSHDIPSREEFDSIKQQDDGTITKVQYFDPDGNALNDDLKEGKIETVTLEKAADDLGAYQGNIATHHESSIDADFAATVDAERAELLIEKPELAEEMGLAKPEAPEPEFDERQLETNPRVQEYIRNKTAETEQAATAYKQGLNNNDAMLRATWAAEIPELVGLPPEDFQRGLELLAQVDRPRFDKAVALLTNFNQVQVAREHHQQYQTHVERQNFEKQAVQEDARFEAMIAKEDPARVKAVKAEVQPYLEKELGIDRDTLRALYNNPVFRSAEAQRMMFDAISYRTMTKAARATPTRTAPHMQRPGTSGPRVSANAESMNALQRQLDSAGSESAQLKIVAKILALKAG
jgi:hypothetical protein